jgi:hypothetical protein
LNGNNQNEVNQFKIEEKQRQLELSYQKIPGWLAILEASVQANN